MAFEKLRDYKIELKDGSVHEGKLVTDFMPKEEREFYSSIYNIYYIRSGRKKVIEKNPVIVNRYGYFLTKDTIVFNDPVDPYCEIIKLQNIKSKTVRA